MTGKGSKTWYGQTLDPGFQRFEALVCGKRGSVRSCQTGFTTSTGNHQFAGRSNGVEDLPTPNGAMVRESMIST